MANCYHKIEYLTYMKECSKIASLCSEKCQRIGHEKGDHLVITCQQLINEVKDKKTIRVEEKSPECQALINEANQIYGDQIKILEMIKDDTIRRLKQMHIETDNTHHLFKCIENQRLDLIKCSDIYNFKRQQLNPSVFLQLKGKQIIQKFKQNLRKSKNQMESEKTKEYHKKISYLENVVKDLSLKVIELGDENRKLYEMSKKKKTQRKKREKDKSKQKQQKQKKVKRISKPSKVSQKRQEKTQKRQVVRDNQKAKPKSIKLQTFKLEGSHKSKEEARMNYEMIKNEQSAFDQQLEQFNSKLVKNMDDLQSLYAPHRSHALNQRESNNYRSDKRSESSMSFSNPIKIEPMQIQPEIIIKSEINKKFENRKVNQETGKKIHQQYSNCFGIHQENKIQQVNDMENEEEKQKQENCLNGQISFSAYKIEEQEEQSMKDEQIKDQNLISQKQFKKS